MKINIYILSFLAIAFSGCSSLLDEDPQYTVNTKTQFSTVQNARKALQGCYGYLGSDNAYGQAWQEMTIRDSGFGYSQTNGSNTDLNVSMNADNTETIVKMAWQGMYKVIGETNAFIANIENSPIDTNEKVVMEASARFLRGLAYYNLVTTFGDIPLKTTPSAHDGVAVKRSPKHDVLMQIESDFKFAYDNLPETKNAGYADKWAAAAYLGKLYHTMGCQGDNEAWKKADTYFSQLEGKYALERKFSSLFVPHVVSSESVFQVNFVLNGAKIRNRGSWIFAPNRSTNGQAWDRVRASKALYDYFNGIYNGDPRIAATFLTSWRNYKGPGQGLKPLEEKKETPRDYTYSYPYYTYTIDGERIKDFKKPLLHVGKIPYERLNNKISLSMDELNRIIADTLSVSLAERCSMRGLKKAIELWTRKSNANTKSWPYFKKAWDPNQSGNNSNMNIIVYRYADALLMYADVCNELGKKDKAVSLINQVLTRARQSAPNNKLQQPANIDNSISKEELRKRIFMERILEGAGEPEMYQKMRIRGVDFLKMLFEINNNHAIIKSAVEANPKRVGNWGERLFNNGNLNDENFLKKNLLLPIPKEEIDTNDALTTNDNNFGY